MVHPEAGQPDLTPALLDGQALAALARGPDAAVPWVLMASFLYYHRDTTILSDGVYDQLTRAVVDNYAVLTHQHRVYLSRLAYGANTSLFDIPEKEYPAICRSAAMRLAGLEVSL